MPRLDKDAEQLRIAARTGPRKERTWDMTEPRRRRAELAAAGLDYGEAIIQLDSQIRPSHIPAQVLSAEISTAIAPASGKKPRDPTAPIVREGYTHTCQLEVEVKGVSSVSSASPPG